MGLVINGKVVEVPGLTIKSWHDDPDLRKAPEDGKDRKTKWVRQVIIHTTGGIPGGGDMRPQVLKPGAGKNTGKDFDVAKFWSGSKLQSGAHLIIDVDGSIACIADLATESMFHAGLVNDNSIGIEIYQEHDEACVYQASIDACVILCNALSELFGIQRQVHLPYLKGPVDRLSKGGADCVGFFGHRDVTSNRGSGDPGDFIMEALVKDGYDKFNFQTKQDLSIWKQRQAWLKEKSNPSLDIDGIPGPGTWEAAKKAGVTKGIWSLGVPPTDVARPIPDPAKTLTEEETTTLKKLVKFIKDV